MGTGPPGVSGLAEIWKVSSMEPTFEMARVRVTTGDPPPEPRLSETGDTAAEAFSAAKTFSNPAPACWMCALDPGEENARSAELIRSDRYCWAVSPGRACLMSAAAPATRGAEKLVPCDSVKPVGSYKSPEERMVSAAV